MKQEDKTNGLNRRNFLQLSALAGVSAAGLGTLLRIPSLHARVPQGAADLKACEKLAGPNERVPITTSIFELFKVGPGPSSSHTIAPMRAANDFMQTIAGLGSGKLSAAEAIEVRLFGSLSATGKGHGTDRAILAGILGQKPETCSPDFLDGLLKSGDALYPVRIGGKTIQVSDRSIIFDKLEHNYPFSNTIIMRLLGPGSSVIMEKEYYSVGGGFIQWKGWTELKRGEPVHQYGNMEKLRSLLAETGLPLHGMIMENEKAIMGSTEEEINNRLDLILKAMEDSVRNGLRQGGVLPGPIGLYRKASDLNKKARKLKQAEARFLVRLSAYALAAAEENAMGHRIVTAPTAGSAGVMPAIAYLLKNNQRCSQDALRKGLLAAAAVGFLAKHNASIAGADAGCQGEIGVAASMAAAMLAYTRGYGISVVEDAAAIAMEHHLGMTCDPVAGYVQVPCIERCAMGAVKAYNAFLIASVETPGANKVSYDVVIRTMATTGKDMLSKYRETSQGGLAVYMVNC